MVDRKVNRLPVVDGAGILVGIVTRADIVRSFARSDEELAREIRRGIVEGILWLPQGSIDVSVEHGEVTLTGETESKDVAELLTSLVENVVGVLSVESRLGWRQRRHSS